MKINIIPAILLLLITGCVTKQSASRVAMAEALQGQIDLGIGYLRKGDYQRAKERLNRALEIEPRSAAAHTTFGLLFQLEGEHPLAEEHFRKAIEYDPLFTQARNNYGAFLFSMDRVDEAITQLEIATEDRFYPNRSQAFENLGVAYAKRNNEDKAEQSFARAIALKPEQARALLELAEIRFHQRQYDEARLLHSRHARVVARQSPRSLWLCIRIARIFNNLDGEASCILALKNIFPGSEEYRLYREDS